MERNKEEKKKEPNIDRWIYYIQYIEREIERER
jgi:hypothetical protein